MEKEGGGGARPFKLFTSDLWKPHTRTAAAAAELPTNCGRAEETIRCLIKTPDFNIWGEGFIPFLCRRGPLPAARVRAELPPGQPRRPRQAGGRRRGGGGRGPQDRGRRGAVRGGDTT